MKKYMVPLYILLVIVTCLYSFVLVDPNITFVQSPIWIQFREYVVQIGYYQRELSWLLYVGIIALLFAAHLYFVNTYKHVNGIRIAIIIAIIFLFSYPFLSHDFFNYMFDARILTYYGKNPYLFKALDFPADQWTRFMHWTHRTYPYGPVFLFLSIIPSFIGLGKFTLTFLLFKAMFGAFYLASVILLTRLNKQWGIMFATHPLILMEGLVSTHNDFISLGLGIIGVYVLLKKTKSLWSRFFFLLSAGIKYTTAPYIAFAPLGSRQKRLYWNKLLFLIQGGVLMYLVSKMGIQPWYFLPIFAFLPFFPRFISRLNIFFFGLMMSYYPYIRLGGWDTPGKVDLRHQIIVFFALLNIIYLVFVYLKKSPKHA